MSDYIKITDELVLRSDEILGLMVSAGTDDTDGLNELVLLTKSANNESVILGVFMDIEEAHAELNKVLLKLMVVEAEDKKEEKTDGVFALFLVDHGSMKINVIKAVREIGDGFGLLGLKEAKDLVDQSSIYSPALIRKYNDWHDAVTDKRKLEAAGATAKVEDCA